MQSDPNTWLEQLRALLSEAPPAGSVEDYATCWEALCDCIDQAPPDLPDALRLPYVEGHLAAWPDKARAPTQDQLRHPFMYQDSPVAPPRWLALCCSFVRYTYPSGGFDYDLEPDDEECIRLIPHLPDSISHLSYRWASPDLLAALPDLLRRLPGLVTLDLGGSALTPSHLGLLLDALPQPRGLRALGLSGTHLGSAGARLLADAPLTGLESLDLYHAEVTEEGTRALGASPHLSALTHLILDSGALPCVGEDLALYAGLPNILRVLEGGVSPWELFSNHHYTYYYGLFEELEEAPPPAAPRAGGRAGGVPRRRGPRRGALGAHLRAVRLGWADAPLLELAGVEASALGAGLQRGAPPLEDLLRAVHTDLIALAGLDGLPGDAARALRDLLRDPDPRVWGQRRWIAAHPELRRWLELRRAQLHLAPRLFALGAPDDPVVLRGALRSASLVVQAFAALLVRHHHPALPARLVYQRLGAPHLEFAPPDVWEEALMLGL